MEGVQVIQHSIWLTLWLWAGIPLIIGSVVGFRMINKEKQRRGAVIWASLAWVPTFFWVVFWTGRGMYLS